jgi:hypothetical protein
VKRAPWPRYAAAAAGLAWFLLIGGGPTLNPRNFRWLMAGDWQQHWLGWLFFRNDPWTFPLGRMTGLLSPVGTNIGFTDSNPLVSLLLKPFSSLLPKYFQFIGPWLALCFALQGYMGTALTSTVTRRPWQQFLGGCLFALSPVLVARLGHDTLCAHWLIIGLLCLGLRECPDAASARRLLWLAAGAAALSASIHPYLAVTCWVLAQAVYVRLWRSQRLTLARAAGAALATTGAMLAVFGAIGYLGTAQLATTGFGAYSSNALTFVNPMGFSRVLPSIDVPAFQWEGFGFLGAGGIVLFLLAAVVAIRRRPSAGRQAWPVFAVSLLMAIYAVSSVVTIGNREVLRLDWLTPLVTPFRASGRFIWSFHYLLLLFGIWGATRAFGHERQAAATALLAGAVALQAADLKTDPQWLAAKDFRPAPISNLKIASGHYRHVALFPMRVLGACGGPYDEERGYRYMYLAYRLDSTYNSGVFARVPAEKVLAECRRFAQAVGRGELEPETIYVTLPESVPLFEKAGAACGQFGEDWMCVSRDSYEPFRRYLLENGRPSPVR